jgi:hypothetical protein
MKRKIVARYLSVMMAAVLCALGGCKPDPGIFFCEGVAPDGKGVKCGTHFTTGDLTALIKYKKNFETDTLELRIFEQRKTKEVETGYQQIKVSPDANTASVNIGLYNEGSYRIVVTGRERNTVADETVKISDTY